MDKLAAALAGYGSQLPDSDTNSHNSHHATAADLDADLAQEVLGAQQAAARSGTHGGGGYGRNSSTAAAKASGGGGGGGGSSGSSSLLEGQPASEQPQQQPPQQHQGLPPWQVRELDAVGFVWRPQQVGHVSIHQRVSCCAVLCTAVFACTVTCSLCTCQSPTWTNNVPAYLSACRQLCISLSLSCRLWKSGMQGTTSCATSSSCTTTHACRKRMTQRLRGGRVGCGSRSASWRLAG